MTTDNPDYHPGMSHPRYFNAALETARATYNAARRSETAVRRRLDECLATGPSLRYRGGELVINTDALILYNALRDTEALVKAARRLLTVAQNNNDYSKYDCAIDNPNVIS